MNRGTCQETLGQTTYSYLVFITQLATDWILVLIPSVVVAASRMRRHQKWLIATVLGFGIVASISACFRIPYLRYTDMTRYPDDFLRKLWAPKFIFVWQLGLIAIIFA